MNIEINTAQGGEVLASAYYTAEERAVLTDYATSDEGRRRSQPDGWVEQVTTVLPKHMRLRPDLPAILDIADTMLRYAEGTPSALTLCETSEDIARRQQYGVVAKKMGDTMLCTYLDSCLEIGSSWRERRHMNRASAQFNRWVNRQLKKRDKGK